MNSENRISANRISANRISANRISANRISANRISANRISANMLSASEMLSTEEGRDLFTYIASCALPAGQTLEATIDGALYSFPGSIGLAPDWEHRALRPREERWVSACLLARVNAHGVSVSISMRGDHDALVASDEEQALYDLEEAAFYGNVFVPADEPIEWAACRGASQAAGENGDLLNRDCGEPDAATGKTQCGFTYAGDCLDFTPASQDPYACKRRDDGHYEKCHTEAGYGEWPEGTKRKEVITVFVRSQV